MAAFIAPNAAESAYRSALRMQTPMTKPMEARPACNEDLSKERLEIAITALRRIRSLGEKNVPKYAQQIASEALARLKHI